MNVERLQEKGALVLRACEMPSGGVTREISLDEAWLQGQLPAQYRVAGDDVAVSFEAHKVGDSVSVKGSLKTKVAYSCSRCGSDATIAVSERLDLLYLPGGDGDIDLTSGEEEIEITDDFQTDVEEYDGNVVDIERPVGEILVLALPEYPRCSDDCRGVCAGCGENLNESTCRCEAVVKDPRWAALAALRERLPESREE